MKKSLLLGNGVNMDFNIFDLNSKNIFNRFKDILISTSPIYEYLFNKPFDLEICDKIFDEALNDSEKQGIESLAEMVYYYLKGNADWTQNHERDLIDFITVAAINAIFYKGPMLIDTSAIFHNNNKNKITILQSYDNIFSLNYTEFWDTSNRCIYLHKEYFFPQLSTPDKAVILYRPYSDQTGTYNNIIDKLSNDFTMVNYSPNVIFTPLLDKQDTLYIGHNPSSMLFPSSNTFPSSVSELYRDLCNIDSLDIFGMSPFGDKRLIKKISEIPYITIYVYQMDTYQVNEWNSLLGRNCCVDSSLFYKNNQ